MVFFIILGVVVLAAFGIIGVLFFMLGKEGQKIQENAVPVELVQLKKELSSPQPLQASVEDSWRQRAGELEEKLLSLSKKAEGQSEEAKQMIESLTKDNESLKAAQADWEASRQKLAELEQGSSLLKSQNDGLQAELDASHAKMRLMEEEMTAIKVQMGDEINRAKALVSELKRENETLVSAPRPEPDEGLRKELEALRAQQNLLQQKYEDLESSQQKLRVLNRDLAEKNEAMQYELIKARAQTSGLERISFNYKNQLEDFFKKMAAAQADQEQLMQVKNRLEGVVADVRSQNEELVKKDQLAQFELEKNRLRLVNLEREYEDFKARTQQKDQ